MRIFVDSTPDKSLDGMNFFPPTIRLGVLTLALMLLHTIPGWTQSRGNEGIRGGDRSDLKPVISGRVLDSLTGEGLAGVNVVAVGARDSALRTGVSTDAQGRFVLTLPRAGGYMLQCTYIGYAPYRRFQRWLESQSVGNLLMAPLTTQLGSVGIEAQAKRIEQRGDTTEINASGYKTTPDADAEQLIRKMPGITVENGTLKVQGEEIRRVLLDGQEYYGNDATAALRNLPADAIDKVQLIDRLSDQAQFSGINDGNTEKTLNLITRTGLNSSRFGKVYGGMGALSDPEQVQGEEPFRALPFNAYGQTFQPLLPSEGARYMSGGNTSWFKGKRRVSAALLANNINQQNFSSAEISGLLGAAGGMGGGMGGMRMMGRGGGMPSGIDMGLNNPTQKGLTATQSLALNYSDAWKGGWKISSALVGNSTLNEQNASARRTWLNVSGLAQADSSRQVQRSNQQRWTARLEWNPDSNRALILTPRMTLSQRLTLASSKTASDSAWKTATTDSTMKLSENRLQSRTENSQWQGGLDLLFRQRLAKARRNYSVNWAMDFQDQSTPRDQNSLLLSVGPAPVMPPQWWQRADTSEQTLNQSRNLLRSRWDMNFIEPLGRASLLEFNLAPLWQSQTVGQDVAAPNSLAIKPLLSQDMEQQLWGAQYGIRYRLGDEVQEWTLGVQRQDYALTNRVLTGMQTMVAASPLAFRAWLPNASWRFSPNRSSQYRVFYRSSAQLPSAQQMQKVLDNSNPLALVLGNPNLDQAISHTVGGRWRWTQAAQGKSCFVFASGSITENAMGNETLVVPADTSLMNQWWQAWGGSGLYGVDWKILGSTGQGLTLPGKVLARGSQLSRPANLGRLPALRFYGTYAHPVTSIKSNLNWTLMGSLQRQPVRNNQVNTSVVTQSLSGQWGLSSSQLEQLDYNISLNMGWNRFRNQGPWSVYWTHTANARAQYTYRKRWVLGSDYSWTYFGGLDQSFNASVHLLNISLAAKVLPNRLGEFRISIFDVLGQNRSVNRVINEVYLEDNRNTALGQFVMLTFTYNFRNFGRPPRDNPADSPQPMSMPQGLPPGHGDPSRPWGTWR
jgi:hypothetical protein